MKKLLAFLLAAILVFALAACGGNDSYAKYEELYQYLEAKDYDSAAAYIQNLAENGEDTSDAKETVPSTEVTEPSYTTVEIDQDNWQDYFEIKLELGYTAKNAFDELEYFYPAIYLRLKDEWAAVAADMDVAVEYSCTGGHYCLYNYDLETGEITEGETVERGSPPEDISSTLKLNMDSINNPRDLTGIVGQPYALETFSLEGNIAKALGNAYSNVEIVRIQGTLTIMD